MSGLLTGKNILVTGAANKRSIAWAVAKAVHREGGKVALAYQGERLLERVTELSELVGGAPLIECDVSSDENVATALTELAATMPILHGLVHSVAFAPAHDLQGSFVETTRAGYAVANDVSAYSLIALTREARRLFAPSAAVVAMTYIGSQRVTPNYNVMGPAKASLEASVRYLAADLGPSGVRVNAISAGPIQTVAARTIKDFSDMLSQVAERTPLRRLITTEEVADATVFLLSDMARGVTGEIMRVDSGAHVIA